MQIPLWKKWLSYLFEWHIESAPSEINPHLYVSLKRGRYQLCAANAVYSYGDLYSNYSRTFRKLPFEQLNIEKVLLLGLGLGSIPYMLEKVFDRHFQYTAVEVDDSVIYLAQKYVLDGLKAPIETIQADAFAFVAQEQSKYDLIAMDIFLDDVVPDRFEQQEFLLNLRSLLASDGLLLYNRLASTMDDRKKSGAFYEKEFLKAFPEGGVLDVGGNWMLHNRKDIF
jgi:hypothetical protein